MADSLAVCGRAEAHQSALCWTFAHHPEAKRAYKVAEQYLKSNPLPDPETLRALVDHAQQAQEQAQALATSHTLPSPETLRALAADATRAQEQMEAFLRSNPLSPREVLDALAARHREYLDTLDEEYGPPSEDDVEAAKRLLDQLGSAAS